MGETLSRPVVHLYQKIVRPEIIKMKAEGLFKASVGEYLFSPWNNNVNIYMYVMDNVV